MTLEDELLQSERLRLRMLAGLAGIGLALAIGITLLADMPPLPDGGQLPRWLLALRLDPLQPIFVGAVASMEQLALWWWLVPADATDCCYSSPRSSLGRCW